MRKHQWHDAYLIHVHQKVGVNTITRFSDPNLSALRSQRRVGDLDGHALPESRRDVDVEQQWTLSHRTDTGWVGDWCDGKHVVDEEAAHLKGHSGIRLDLLLVNGDGGRIRCRHGVNGAGAREIRCVA